MTMRDCADAAMRDRLPLFVTGRLTDSDSTMVEAHLASCSDCVAEVDLLRAVGRAYAVPAIDAAVVAAAIPAPRRKRTAYYQQPMWRVAAAMTLMIAGTAGVLVMRRADPGIMGSGRVDGPERDGLEMNANDGPGGPSNEVNAESCRLRSTMTGPWMRP